MEEVPLKEKTEDTDVGVRINFEDGADEKKFVCMLSYMHRCMCIFLVLSAVTLCSGRYTAHESSMDAVIMTTDMTTACMRMTTACTLPAARMTMRMHAVSITMYCDGRKP